MNQFERIIRSGIFRIATMDRRDVPIGVYDLTPDHKNISREKTIDGVDGWRLASDLEKILERYEAPGFAKDIENDLEKVLKKFEDYGFTKTETSECVIFKKKGLSKLIKEKSKNGNPFFHKDKIEK